MAQGAVGGEGWGWEGVGGWEDGRVGARGMVRGMAKGVAHLLRIYLKGYAPCRRPPLGVWAVVCWLCCAGWAGLLGWAGLAMLARMSWAGWAGQVRLAGFAFILSPFCLVVVSLFFLLTFYVVFDAMFELWFILGFHFGPFWHLWETIWSTRGFPGQLCAHLLGCSEPQGPNCMQKVVSQPQRCHFREPFLASF